MTSSDRRRAPMEVAPPRVARSAGALLRAAVRSRWAVVPLLVVVAVASFFVARGLTPPAPAQPLPASLSLPPNARLVWYDAYVQAHIEDWTYAVAGQTNESLTAFYQAQLPRDGWRCVQMATMSNITRQGTAYTGTSNYLAAWRGTTRVQIYTADQEYGAFLLQGDLPANSIALKITLEIEDQAQCP